MTATQQDYLNCSADVVGGLIEAVTIALMEDFPRTSVDEHDVELLLDALHVLRPGVAEVGTLDGLLHIACGRWDDAVHVLRQVEESAPHFSYAKALLAFSLSAKGDPGWRQHANEVVSGSSSRGSEALVRALMAREDVLGAERVARLGGAFVMPESVAALHAIAEPGVADEAEVKEEVTADAAKPEAPAHTTHYGSYMRA
ncbi:type III secretion protein HrpB1 [Burkholderia sp. D7]|nr:type III secretion protein HrpB1 [Burkholderia sp. D7]